MHNPHNDVNSFTQRRYNNIMAFSVLSRNFFAKEGPQLFSPIAGNAL